MTNREFSAKAIKNIKKKIEGSHPTIFIISVDMILNSYFKSNYEKMKKVKPRYNHLAEKLFQYLKTTENGTKVFSEAFKIIDNEIQKLDLLSMSRFKKKQ